MGVTDCCSFCCFNNEAIFRFIFFRDRDHWLVSLIIALQQVWIPLKLENFSISRAPVSLQRSLNKFLEETRKLGNLVHSEGHTLQRDSAPQIGRELSLSVKCCVPTAVFMKVQAFRHVTTFQRVSSYSQLRRIIVLSSQRSGSPIREDLLTQKMKALLSFETSVFASRHEITFRKTRISNLVLIVK